MMSQILWDLYDSLLRAGMDVIVASAVIATITFLIGYGMGMMRSD